MERDFIIKHFSHRLILLMQQCGLKSTRSKAGVKIDQLAKVSGCSFQMARRYVLGEALPEIDVVFKIAKWLNVSPGWLLFGEESQIPNNIKMKNLIQIDFELLHYILLNCAHIFSLTNDKKELIQFIMDLINDATHIEADKQTILKIINISINSATRFQGVFNEKKIQTV